jgi:hypothetical protein
LFWIAGAIPDEAILFAFAFSDTSCRIGAGAGVVA